MALLLLRQYEPSPSLSTEVPLGAVHLGVEAIQGVGSTSGAVRLHPAAA